MEKLTLIFSCIELIGGIHGAFLAFLLWRVPQRLLFFNKILIALLLAISYMLLWGALHDSHYLVNIPDLMGTGPAVALVLGPLLYFYVRAVVQPDFCWRKMHLFHFIPVLLFLVSYVPFLC